MHAGFPRCRRCCRSFHHLGNEWFPERAPPTRRLPRPCNHRLHACGGPGWHFQLLTRISLTLFPPVSEREEAGVEELENQTTKLLSFQPIAETIFDTQVAFNLLNSLTARKAKPHRSRMGVPPWLAMWRVISATAL